MQSSYEINLPDTLNTSKSYQVSTKPVDTVDLRSKATIRELKGQYEVLMKDNERKTHKIDSMVKEMQTLRASQNSHQVRQ